MLFQMMSRLVARQKPTQAAALGARLTACGPGTWVADRELTYAGGSRLPIRMLVVEDPARELNLYSPVALDEGTIEALAGLGEVRRIIVPNRFHTLFVDDAMASYPSAELLLPETCAGLDGLYGTRVRKIHEATTIGSDTEIVAVTLRRGLVELVVYNDAAELLAVTDLLFNLHHAEGVQRWLLMLNGVWRKPAMSRLQRFLLVKDRQSLGAFYRWAMSRPFSQISMAHGLLVTEGARETFYQLFHRFHDYGGNGIPEREQCP
jgi:hypothetical protein